jgi:CheY-like chemotaxis protein
MPRALAPPAGGGGAPTPLRIVVADDNQDAAEACATLLELCGHSVAVAFDGREALRLAAGFRPHVMLLDIGMPKLTGYEVARETRAEPWGREVVLIALTGWGQEEDRRRTLAAGFDRHLTKPIDPEEIKKLLQTIAADVAAAATVERGQSGQAPARH